MPGGAVPRGGVCKTGEVPARGAAQSAAGGRRRRAKRGGRAPEAPKGGRRVPRRGGTTPPRDAKPAGENANFPQNLPAERVLPAPRAGERTLSAFLHWLRPLRPVPGTVRSRPARVPRNHFPRCNPRALPEIKDNRFPLHKHSVSAYPLSLLSAFPQNLTVPRGERTLPPRPSPQSGRAGYSRRGSAPQGEPFPATFPFARKSSPCGAKTNNYCLYRIRSKTSPPCGTK